VVLCIRCYCCCFIGRLRGFEVVSSVCLFWLMMVRLFCRLVCVIMVCWVVSMCSRFGVGWL